MTAWGMPPGELGLVDRQSIFRHIVADNSRAASEMDDLFIEKANLLAEWPEMGRPGRLLGTREFLAHRSYLLIYIATTDELHILRVLHTSRQWPQSGSRSRPGSTRPATP